MICHLRPRAAQTSLQQTTFFAARAQTEPPNSSAMRGSSGDVAVGQQRCSARSRGARPLRCNPCSAPCARGAPLPRGFHAAEVAVTQAAGQGGCGHFGAVRCSVPLLWQRAGGRGRRSCRVPRAVRSSVLRGGSRPPPCLSTARCLRDPALLTTALPSARTDGLGGNVRHVWYRPGLLNLASVVCVQ